MSEDEIVVLLVSGFGALALWAAWLRHPIQSPLSRRSARYTYGFGAISACLLLTVLLTLAADDVRRDVKYIMFYLVLGAAWVSFWTLVLPYFGLSIRDDVAERDNVAAGIALGGVLLALTIAFAGGNIGNGPGWWVVVISATLATIGLLVLWAMIELFADTSELITVDRDVASAVRFTGLLVAISVVLGRAVAGDWISLDATVADFWRVAWAAVPIAAVGIVIDRISWKTGARSLMAIGIVPAFAYLSAAAWYVVMRLPAP